MKSGNSTLTGGNDEDSSSSNAPTSANFENFLQLMGVGANKSVIEIQLNHLVEVNAERLEPLERAPCPKVGEALNEQAVKTIFYLCQELQVPNFVKYHALELYDRWVLCMEEEWKRDSVAGLLEATSVKRLIRNECICGMAVCIELASKSAGIGSNVTPEDIRTALSKCRVKLDLKTINELELSVLDCLDQHHSLKTTTSPMEIIDHLLALLGLKQSDYEALYGICISILDLFYLKRDDICALLQSQPLWKAKNDYVLRAAAIVQTAAFVHWSLLHTAVLPKLQKYANLDQAVITEMMGAILFVLSSND